MSNMADEDEEFLYGDTEMENAENNNNSKNDEAELYDLYGDDETKENEQKEESPEKILETQHDKKIEEPEAKAVTEESKAEENDKDKNSDSDSDDDLEIILEPEEEPQNETETEQVQTEQSTTNEAKETLVNIKPGQQTKSSTAPATAAFSNANQSSKTAQGGINLEGVGEYNGQPINEVNLDDFEDKPWRKPGADITDYFNYGFNEVTWRAYCAKQKMLRENKKLMGDMNMSEMNMNDFMNMGDMMTMGDVMHMGMMMPPNMMDGSMPPIPMGGMPNPMMGMPMGLPGPPPPSGSSTHQNGSNSMPRSSRNSAINPMRSSTRDISMPRHSGSGNGSSSSSNNRRSDSRERRKRSYDAYRRD